MMPISKKYASSLQDRLAIADIPSSVPIQEILEPVVGGRMRTKGKEVQHNAHSNEMTMKIEAFSSSRSGLAYVNLGGNAFVT
jgi:hypothetical protein